jgi:hypothetical protein
MGGFIARGRATLPSGAPTVGQYAVVLSTPDALLTYNMCSLQLVDPTPRPRGLAVVSVQEHGTPTLTRTGDRTFTIENPEARGLGMFGGVFRDSPLRLGQRHETDVMTVTVTALRPEDGALLALDVELHQPHEQLRFLVWKGRTGFEEVHLPALGQSMALPATRLFDVL